VRHEMALAVSQAARIKSYNRQDPLEAAQLFAQSVVLYEAVGDRWGLAHALAYLGWMAKQIGKLAEAEALCERSLAARQELGDKSAYPISSAYSGLIGSRLCGVPRVIRWTTSVFTTCVSPGVFCALYAMKQRIDAPSMWEGP